MRIAIWGTKHEIARTVADAVLEGFETLKIQPYIFLDADEIFYDADIHIGYGILRGMDKIFKESQRRKQAFFLIDRGYWNPSHYDGYYRISLNGTQQTTGLDKLEPDYGRWKKLGLEILPAVQGGNDYCLICPPTDYVCKFFNNTPWSAIEYPDDPLISDIRPKGTDKPIDWNRYSEIRTFNSSVGWEALRQGIHVVSDPTHSIVGAYQKMVDKPINQDYEQRLRLFAIQASLQLTLQEIRSGLLWPLLSKLLVVSAGTAANQSPVMSLPTA